MQKRLAIVLCTVLVFIIAFVILQNILSPFWNERFPKGGAR